MLNYAEELTKLSDRQLLLLIAGITAVELEKTLGEDKTIQFIRLTKTIEWGSGYAYPQNIKVILMNKKDYIDIAGIIKGQHLAGEEKSSESVRLVINETLRGVANKLADYFEREDATVKPNESKYCSCGHPQSHPLRHKHDYKFNRQQFLKDCGVEKWNYLNMIVWIINVTHVESIKGT